MADPAGTSTEDTAHTSERLLSALEAATAHALDRAGALRQQRESRAANLQPQRPSEEELKQLDASIKKNGALVKKLKVLSAANLDVVIADIQKTNQSKFLAEAASSVAEAIVKPARAPSVLKVSELLHRRYEDFAPALAAALLRCLQPKHLLDAERDSVLRRQACIRVLVDLDLLGMYGTVASLEAPIRALASASFRGGGPLAVAGLAQLTAFARAAREGVLNQPADLAVDLPPGAASPQALAAGDAAVLAPAAAALLSAVEQLSSELQQRYVVPEALGSKLASLVGRAFKAASAALVALHEELMAQELRNAQITTARGILPAEAQQEYESARKQYDAFHGAVEGLSVAIDAPMPELQALNVVRLEASDVRVAQLDASGAGGDDSLWDDPSVRTFYESLPDLEAVVPGLALVRGKDAAAPDAQEPSGTASAPAGNEGEVPTDASQQADAGSVATDAAEAADDAPADEGGAADPNVEALKAVLEQVPKCLSREAADEVAVNFCFIQTKGKRKALARLLTNMFKLQLQLVPFYARITATLSQHFPDVGQMVCAAVLDEFGQLARQKDATSRTLEPRLRNARYIVELLKFRVLDAGSFFVCLKTLLDDFSQHNIDAACELVLGAGAFLIRQPATNTRMENMLEVMLRLKGARNLDSAKALLVDSACFACRPPQAATLKERRHTPLQRYIRHLIFESLDTEEATMLEVVKRIRRLPWAESEAYLLKCMLKGAVKGRFVQIQLIASLLSALSKYRDSLAISMIDLLLEEVREGLAHPELTDLYQRRVAYARLFAECYNYQVTKSQHLFYLLYLLIQYGYDDPEHALQLDPPDDFFRVRLVLTILKTAGHYFNKGSARRKMDRFLLFLQRYVLAKDEPPIEVQLALSDVLQQLRPGLHRFETFQEANAAVGEWLLEEAANGGGDDAEDDNEASSEDAREAAEDGEAAAADALGDDDAAGEGGSGVVLGQSWVLAQQQQADELFEKELAALMPPQATLQQAVGVMRAPVVGGGGSITDSADGAGVAFKVRMKRGGRDDESHVVSLPAASGIAAHLQRQREQEAAERSQLKKLVLAADKNQRAEEMGANMGGARGRARKSYLSSRDRR